MFIFFDLLPIVFCVGLFMKEIMLVILCATESMPVGKMILDDCVLICLHLMEDGSAANFWAAAGVSIRVQRPGIKILRILNIGWFLN